ncbi:MAG TPA: decarboxylase [Planctomycetota bacterium]|nr:decarboxylase [Planctomycetota bacterium]
MKTRPSKNGPRVERVSAPAGGEAASGLDHFLSAVAARHDRWRELTRAAQAWAAGGGAAQEAEAARKLEALRPFESFQAFPGPRLMAALEERVGSGDAQGTLRIVQRVIGSLMSRGYRAEGGDGESDEEATLAERVLPTTARESGSRPYFEVAFVTPAPPARWAHQAQQIRRLRRPQDEFIYEPVMVGSFEDALLAVILNVNLEALVIYDGFLFDSLHDVPLFKSWIEARLPAGARDAAAGDYGLLLARVVKQVRPELDLYLLADRQPDDLLADPGAAGLRRIFYEVEEPLEIHLSVLEGVAERFETPYFDNLKRYAQKPVGTFHALPIARGKSIFRSNWIRDLGEFYGPTLFLAESSATTGGLDSLLEPTGNIKKAQDAAARAFGADRVFFVTNGTSTSNKMVHQALLEPGDIVIADRNCHKSHHYGMVLAGAQPCYVEAFPLVAYSMYGAVPLRAIKQALLELKAAGRLDKVRLVTLTNCTFDGHVYDTRRVMEECLAIKPDLIFLWDEAWFGFARFSPFLRPRTAMGARQALKEAFADPAYLERYLAQAEALGADLDPKDKRVLETRLVPDPRRAKLRVYQCNSTHKSMSALRQGSMVLVGDEDFAQHEQAFKEAVFTHASTSPNLQIIASLDVARRQMELEGYELVMGAIQNAFDIRRQVNGHPLISKYFRVLDPAQMIPDEFRPSGLASFTGGATWVDGSRALREDEFMLDPTRITLVCGTAGFDGTQFKNLLASEYEIQLNKTSRNSILLQTNINNTRSDVANLVKVLADISRGLEERLKSGGEPAQAAFKARVKSLMEDVPDLPNFSRFHDRFRDDPKGRTLEGDMRSAFYMAYDSERCEHIKLMSPEIDKRLASGPPLVSAHFVIPYPPGFPIMVPGQVIAPDTIEFMRKLDVKEIHGYDATLGLKLIRPEVLGEGGGGGGAASGKKPRPTASAGPAGGAGR